MLGDFRRPLVRHLQFLLSICAVLLFGGCRPAEQPAKSPSTKDSPTTVEEPAESHAADAHAQEQPPTEVIAKTGPELYARHCAACHGERGDGLGLAARFVFPKPRDFRTGKFRLVSTANNVPSREDLHAVLLRGMPGSSMPPWKHLSQAERDALVDEVQRLRREGAAESYIRVLKEEEELTDEEIAAEEVQQDISEFVEGKTTPGESSVVPEMGQPNAEAIARGAEVYAKFGCIQCHGKDGKGDGVQKMLDDEKVPTAPRDFTLGIFKGGDDPASLYRRIAYGMPGTPMPSSQQMTPEQMVDLVHFVRSLSTDAQRAAAVLNREKIVVKAVNELPKDAGAAAWDSVAPATLHLVPLWWRNSDDANMQVQAVHDGKSIAVRLSWKDATSSEHATQSQAFEDLVALELYRGAQEPFIGMGDPWSPVDVWTWDADRQSDPTIEEQYPRVVVDIYPFSEKQVATAEFERPGTERANQPPVSLPAVASGNQIVPDKSDSGGSDLAADGPGSATFRLPKNQLVTAHGEWKDGRWTVLLTRPLATKSAAEGVALQPGGKASVAFAVWDGEADDRDGMKRITIWQDLLLEQ